MAASMEFNVDAARKAGYSDAEIADYLGSRAGFDAAGARASGYSDGEIISHLANRTAPKLVDPNHPGAMGSDQVAGWEGRGVTGVIGGAPATNNRLSILDSRTAPGDFMYGAARGAKDVVDTGAELLARGVAGKSEGDRIRALNEAGKAQWEANKGNPIAAIPGRIVGQIAATAPLLAATGGAAATVSPALGASIRSSGALRSIGGQAIGMPTRMAGGAVAGGLVAGAIDPKDAAMGAAFGGAFPPVAEAASAVGRRIAAPFKSHISGSMASVRDSAEKLGFKTTPGQATRNPTLLRAEAAMGSNPMMSSRFDAIKEHNQQTLNRIAAKAIGQNADSLPESVLGKAADDIGAKFEAVASDNIALGNSFKKDVMDAAAKYRSVWGGKGDSQIGGLIDDAMKDASAGAISGQRYTTLRSELSKTARDAYKTGKSRIGEAVNSLIDALDNAAVKSLPGDKAQALEQARAQWKTLLTIEKSMNGENVSGLKLANAFRRADPTGFIRGKRSSDLYTAAKFSDQFRQIVGDSGTATRQALLPIMAASAAGGAVGGVPGAVLGPAAMQAIPALYLSDLMRGVARNQVGKAGPLALPNASRLGPLLAGPAAALATQQ